MAVDNDLLNEFRSLRAGGLSNVEAMGALRRKHGLTLSQAKEIYLMAEFRETRESHDAKLIDDLGQLLDRGTDGDGDDE